MVSFTTHYRYQQIIQTIKEKLSRQGIFISEKSEQFKFLVIEESEEHQLDLEGVQELAKSLGIPYEKVPYPYSDWIPSLSNILSCMKYTNPCDPREYILQVPSRNCLGSMEILHHGPKGFTSIEIFQKLIPYSLPNLEDLRNNLFDNVKIKHPDVLNFSKEKQGAVIRGAFSKSVSKPIHDAHPNLDPYTIRLIHAFFEIGIPEIDGICLQCFKVFMPKSGFGICYERKIADNLYYEIRISPEKLGGKTQQTEIYITNRLNIRGTIRYIKWQPTETPAHAFTQNVEEFITHIPYRSNDQKSVFKFLSSENTIKYFRQFAPNTSNLVIPLCQCHQKP